MGYNVGKPIVTDGLILHLDAGNTRSYVGTGTTWYDISGNSNSGSLLNGPTYGNRAVVLDGINDYIDCGAATAIGSGLTGLTLNIFTYPTLYGLKCIVENGTGWSTNTFYLFLENGYFSFLVRGNSYNQVYSDFLFQTNTWYNITATWSSGFLPDIYCNGRICSGYRNGGGAMASLINGDTHLLIGSRNYNQYFYGGSVGLVSIYNRALTQSEIQQNFEALRGRYGI